MCWSTAHSQLQTQIHTLMMQNQELYRRLQAWGPGHREASEALAASLRTSREPDTPVRKAVLFY